MISTEGANQVVEGTARDTNENIATALVTVNIDRTPPVVAFTTPPLTLTTQAEITLTTGVSDLLSGVASANCNGAAATIVDGVVTCTVPLYPGMNSLSVVAADSAGNTQSVGVRIKRVGTPTRASITPLVRTLLVDDERFISMIDEFGEPLDGVQWSTSDDAIAEVVEVEGDVAVRGISSGEVEITGAINGLTATTTINVVAALTLPLGSVKWHLPKDGPQWYRPLTATAVSGSDVRTYSFDFSEAGMTVRALSSDGEQVWSELRPQAYRPLFSDIEGGVVLVEGNGLARIGGGPGTIPWRWETDLYFPTEAAPGNGYVVQAADGTIYVMVGMGADFRIIGLDGRTGPEVCDSLTHPALPGCRNIHRVSVLVVGPRRRLWAAAVRSGREQPGTRHFRSGPFSLHVYGKCHHQCSGHHRHDATNRDAGWLINGPAAALGRFRRADDRLGRLWTPANLH